MNDHRMAGDLHPLRLPFRYLNFGRAETFLLAAAVISLLAGAVLFPSEFLHAAPECPLHRWSSFYCAGCGTTRAIVALLGGDWAAALRYNVLFMLSLALAIPVLCAAAARSLKEKRLSAPFPLRPFAVPVLCVGILFMILRNLPFAPWSLLAP
jgi:hypothetical protein